MNGECPNVEMLERLAGGGSIGNDVVAHARQCESCQTRLREIQANLALLPDLAALATVSTSSAGPEHAIDGYDIHETIARGSQGIVYHATQRATKRAVAIKVLLGGKFATQRQRIRFEREVELAAALRHPNIVTYFDSGTTVDGRRFCVMEFVNGKPLHEYLQEQADASSRPMPRDVLALFLKICSAVAYAHQRGVIHRDLKPANILIDASGEPRVVDFGLARTLEAIGHVREPTVTHAGEFAGTFAYASPEQTMGGHAEVDVRSDVYSLGVILFEMLTASLPYKTDGPLSGVIKAICEQPPLSPSALRRDVDHELETILLKTLSKSPERRYQSVGALMRDLQHHLAGEPIDAKRDSRWYMLRKTVHRHRYAASVVVFVVILLTAFSILMSVAYQRASLAEAVAAARSDELAESLSRSNIERGRVLASSGNVALAEEVLWKEHLRSARPDDELAASRWGLRALYLQNPCRSSVNLPVVLSNERCLMTSPDGSLVIFGDLNAPFLEMCRAETGEIVTTIPRPDAMLNRQWVFFAGKQKMATILSDRSIAIFDVARGTLLSRGAPLERQPLRIAMSKREDRFAVYDQAGRISILNATTLEEEHTIETGVSPLAIAFGDEDASVVTGAMDGILRVWSIETASLVRQSSSQGVAVRIGHGINVLAASEDQSMFVTANESGRSQVWAANDLSRPRVADLDGDTVAVAISPDGKWIATGGNDRVVKVHDLETGELRQFAGHVGPIRSLAFSADGRGITSVSKEGGVRMWDLTPSITKQNRHTSSVLGMVHDEGDDLIVTSSADGSIVLTDSKCQTSQRIDVGPVLHALAISADRFIATADRTGTIHLYPLVPKARAGRQSVGPARSFKADASAINAIAFSPDGTTLVTAAQSGETILWNLETLARSSIQLAGSAEPFSSIQFSPDGAMIAAGGKWSGDVRLWNARDGSERPRLQGHTDIVRCVTFSPDGKWLASGSDDQTTRLWTLDTGECVATLEGHQRAVFGVSFRADGKLLASAGGGDVRIWSVPERRLLASFTPTDAALLGVHLSDDGSRLWTWGTTGDLICVDLARADAFIDSNRAYWTTQLEPK